MSLQQLTPGGLYIWLTLRDSPPTPNDYHVGLYHHKSAALGGTKNHIRNLGAGWIPEHADTRSILDTLFLVGLVHIGNVPAGCKAAVGKLMHTFDNTVNDVEGMTCRVWVMQMLELLRQPIEGYTVLKCSDVEVLKLEVYEWANSHAASADRNEQPRPVGTSKFV